MDPILNEQGLWVIPASQRPDGTWRKERILKEGYVPPDEIKAFATKSRKSGLKTIPGMAPIKAVQSNKTTKNKEKSISKPSGNELIHNNQNKSKDLEQEMITVNTEFKNISIVNSINIDDDVDTKKDSNSDLELSKRIKALTKKLRDITDIEIKPKDKLTMEQIEKISKKSIIENELQELKTLVATKS